MWTGVGAATFLFHGGEIWDTAHTVMAHHGTASENVNALEAASTIPEPSSIALLGMGGLALLGYGLRRKRKRAA